MLGKLAKICKNDVEGPSNIVVDLACMLSGVEYQLCAVHEGLASHGVVGQPLRIILDVILIFARLDLLLG